MSSTISALNMMRTTYKQTIIQV